MKHALPLKIGIGFSLLDIKNVSSIIWRSFVSFFGFCFIPDECGGHSAEVANKKSTFPPFSFESNKRFHVNHPALAGRDREKKEDSSPLFFCLLGFVSLAGRRAIGRRSFFFISVCVVASASFHQVNYPFREQRRADMRGMQPSDEFDWSRAERVCLLVYFFSSLHPTAMETLV